MINKTEEYKNALVILENFIKKNRIRIKNNVETNIILVLKKGIICSFFYNYGARLLVSTNCEKTLYDGGDMVIDFHTHPYTARQNFSDSISVEDRYIHEYRRKSSGVKIVSLVGTTNLRTVYAYRSSINSYIQVR
jgi:hypothetical protein